MNIILIVFISQMKLNLCIWIYAGHLDASYISLTGESIQWISAAVVQDVIFGIFKAM